jgi:hypothetical protein
MNRLILTTLSMEIVNRVFAPYPVFELIGIANSLGRGGDILKGVAISCCILLFKEGESCNNERMLINKVNISNLITWQECKRKI